MPRGARSSRSTFRPRASKWNDVVPEAAGHAATASSFVNDQFVLNYLQDAHTQIKIYDTNGKFVRDVNLPGIGTAGGFGGKRNDTETFYTYSSFNAPPTIYRYDMKTGKSTLFRQAKVEFDPSAITRSKQVFYPSKDGTQVPMFIDHKKGHQARRHQSDAPLRLRRFQHSVDARIFGLADGVARDGRRLCGRVHSRRQRVRQGLVEGRLAAQQTECFRRFHRGPANG